MNYTKLKRGTLVHGECIEVMKTIPDNYVDMILCDLPYGTTRCKWDSIIPFDQLWEQYKRILRESGAIILTATQPFTSLLISSNIEYFKHCLVWDKVKPNGHLVAKHRPMQRTEDIVIFCKNSPIYNPIMIPRSEPKKSKEYKRTEIMGGVSNNIEKTLNDKFPTNVLVFSNANQKGKIHPTQKPVELFEYLIKTYSNKDYLILDKCSGSGTTAIACENTNRDWICIEQDENYYNESLQRIINHESTSTD